MFVKFFLIDSFFFLVKLYSIFLVSVVSELRICRPPPLFSPPFRSIHLDIKYAQCAENKNGRKISYHIMSHLGVQEGRFGRPKNSNFFISSQTCREDWNWSDTDFFAVMTFFCTILSSWDMIFFWQGTAPPAPLAGATPQDPACFRIKDPSWNRLASTAYFAKPRYAASLPRYA